MPIGETSHDLFTSKPVCEVTRTKNCSFILIFTLFLLENTGLNCFNVPLLLHVFNFEYMQHDSPSTHYFTDQPFMNET